MRSFTSRLSYSFGNEDWETEHRALKIKPNDRVLCVTASGDRPLHTLLDNPKEVVSIDLNPIQNYLLSLKMAAIRHLDFDRYLSFLGASPDPYRAECLRTLTKHMDAASSQYWLKNETDVVKGILYQGATEKWTHFISSIIGLARGKKVDQLFAFDNLEEQKKFIQQQWDQFLWKKSFHVFLNPFFSRLFLKDPGLYAHVDSSIHVGSYLYERMNKSLMRHLARENSLLSLLFRGRVGEEAFPPYLTEKGFDVIKKRLDRISFQPAELVSFVENSPENHFDVFSLSDVASYISANDFNRLAKALYQTAKPKARFSIREFMSKHQIPKDIKKAFKRDSKLEQQLEKIDRCFVYRFMVGSIDKT